MLLSLLLGSAVSFGIAGEAAAQASNDTCGNAMPVGYGTIAFDNTGSAFNGVDLGGACMLIGDSMFDNDLYYCFQAPATGQVNVTFTELSNTNPMIPFEPRLAILDGCFCPANPVDVIACVEGNGVFVTTFSAVGGNSYLIVVGGFFAFGTGTGEIDISGPMPSLPEFERGDCNADGATNLSDAVALLTFLFPPAGCTPGVDCPTIACADACDTNDDGSLNLSDAIVLLGALFPMGCTPGVDCPTLPDPTGACGPDPTAGDALDCAAFSPCP